MKGTMMGKVNTEDFNDVFDGTTDAIINVLRRATEEIDDIASNALQAYYADELIEKLGDDAISYKETVRRALIWATHFHLREFGLLADEQWDLMMKESKSYFDSAILFDEINESEEVAT